jgi:hypothetical protein
MAKSVDVRQLSYLENTTALGHKDLWEPKMFSSQKILNTSSDQWEKG